MREILFRGKAKETNYRYKEGEWIYGNLVKMLGTDGEDKLCIQPWERDVEGVNSVITEVAPETIGQYTGLTDKNGKKIFEGDILKSCYDEIAPEDFVFELVLWEQNGWSIKQGNSNPDALTDEKALLHSEVISNIYDNPDLLKGVNENDD